MWFQGSSFLMWSPNFHLVSFYVSWSIFFFNISCSARLLIINSVSFHMPEKVFMSPSVFKEVFLGCRRLDGCFNSFRALKTFRCHLACLCSAVIPIFFQIRMKHEIYISYAFFLPGCFYIFLFITGFKRFDWYTPWYSFLQISCDCLHWALCVCVCACVSRSVVSDSLWPHGP